MTVLGLPAEPSGGGAFARESLPEQYPVVPAAPSAAVFSRPLVQGPGDAS